MKRSRPLRRRKALAPISAKRRSELAQRADVRMSVLARDRYVCTLAHVVPEVGCSGPLDVDEVIPRSAWPGGWLVASNCRTVCRAHHNWRHTNPAEADRRGLVGWSWDRRE